MICNCFKPIYKKNENGKIVKNINTTEIVICFFAISFAFLAVGGIIGAGISFIPGFKKRIFKLIKLENLKNNSIYFKIFSIILSASFFILISFFITIPSIFICVNKKRKKEYVRTIREG